MNNTSSNHGNGITPDEFDPRKVVTLADWKLGPGEEDKRSEAEINEALTAWGKRNAADTARLFFPEGPDGNH